MTTVLELADYMRGRSSKTLDLGYVLDNRKRFLLLFLRKPSYHDMYPDMDSN